MGEITVVGGQMNFPFLTNKLPADEYAKAKAHIWLLALNEGNKPKKWLKPNSKGTKINFETVQSQEEYDNGLEELGVFLKRINEEFGLDYSIKKD